VVCVCIFFCVFLREGGRDAKKNGIYMYNEYNNQFIYNMSSIIYGNLYTVINTVY